MVNFRKHLNLDRTDCKSPLLLLPSNAALFLKGLHTRLARRLAGKSRGFRAAAGFGLCFVLVSLVFVSATSCMSNGTSDGQALEVHLDNPITMTGGTLNSTTTVVNNTTTLIGNTTTQVQNTTTQYPTTTIQNTTTVQNTTTQYPTTTIQNTTTQYPTTTQVNNTTTQVNNTTTQVATTTVGCLYGAAGSIPAIGSVPDGQMYIDTDDGHWWQAQYVNIIGAIEQSNSSGGDYRYVSANPQYWGQTFTTINGYNLQTIKWYSKSFPPDIVKCEIYATSGGLPTGTALASDTETISNSDYQWNSWTFSSPLTLSGTTTYAICMTQMSTGSMEFELEDSDSGALYSNGDGWNAYSGYEAEFETLSESSSGEQWVEIK